MDDDVIVAKYLKKVQTDLKALQATAKAAADLDLADFKSVMDMAEESVARAKKRFDFEDGLTKVANASKAVVDGKVTANGLAITANATAITAAEAKIKKAIATCKGIGYNKAQEGMKNLLAKIKADAA